MRHAYLIMAHNEFKVLSLLVSLLDSGTNDIFIHMDRKIKNLPDIHTEKSGLYFIDDRFDVRWGCLSQIKAEFALLRAARIKNTYSHYCIISGVHLPLLDICQIDNIIDNYTGKSIFKLWKVDEGEVFFRFGSYHFFTEGCYSNNRIVARLSNIAWRALNKVQRTIGIHRNTNGFVKADQWCILSDEAVHRLLKEEKSVLSRYCYSFCSDEYIMPTELSRMNLPYIDCQYLLYTEFIGSRPKVFDVSEWESVKKTQCLFARKFSL